MSGQPFSTARRRERMFTCGVLLLSSPPKTTELCPKSVAVEAAEAEVWRTRPGALTAAPATLFGKGKVEEIGEEAKRIEADGIVVDNDLTPAQGRNLEKAGGCA